MQRSGVWLPRPDTDDADPKPTVPPRAGRKADEFGASTYLVHGDRLDRDLPCGALFEQRFDSVAHEFRSADAIEAVFQGREKAYAYGRQGSPTIDALERKITRLEDSIGTVVFSSGMSAYDAMFATLFRSGDHVLASNFLFSNTVSLLRMYRDRWGVEVDFVDVRDKDIVVGAIRDNTVAIIVETVANPGTQIPCLEQIGALSMRHGIVFVVDNTVLSPVGFRPNTVGASLVVHSLTKLVAGHGRSLGGSVSDTGLHDWTRSRAGIDPEFQPHGPLSYLAQLRRKGRTIKGTVIGNSDAAAIAMGLETLPLRFERSARNAHTLAEHLSLHPKIDRVFHPGLSSHPQHAIARDLFRAGCPFLSFVLGDEVTPHLFLDRLGLIAIAVNLGETRTMAIPAASTIFHEMGPDMRRTMGIPENLIRLSVGIEDVEDLMRDIDSALGSRP
jgi:O-acetylhomoserine (thiol)-lyase